MLYALSLYQIVSCSLSIIFFAFGILFWEAKLFGFLSYLLSAALIGLAVYVIYVNSEFIVKRKITPGFRIANRWFNILQGAHLSLLGVTFYCLVGPAITPGLIYSDHISWQINLNFGFRFNLSYQPKDSDLYAGINLVPIVYLYLFHHAVRKAESTEEFELDLFKTPSAPQDMSRK